MTLSDFDIFILALGAMGLGTMMLVRGGDWTIDAAVYIAKQYNISPLLIGFTIVAFGTSLPELIISINANLKDSPGIAIGNVLGSNIANILLVIGSAALVSPIIIKPKEILKDTIMMNVATCAMIAIFLYGIMSQITGLVMVAALMLYVIYQYKTADKQDEANIAEEIEEQDATFARPALAYFFLLSGLVFIALGAEFLVRGAQYSAAYIHVPEAVIALSLIAFGTSLPELATCVAAALKKHTDLIVGNIVGSNVFNILMILGFSSMFKPIYMANVEPQIVHLDMWITLAITVFFSLWLLVFKKVSRFIGGVFVSGYVAYILAIYLMYM